MNSSSHGWLILNSKNFQKLIEYYTAVGNRTLIKEEYTAIKESTLLNDIKIFYVPYPTVFQGGHSQPNPAHIVYTTIVVKNFYTTIGQYPTLYNFLAITPEEISHWNYYLTYPNKYVKPKIFNLHYYDHHCTPGRCCITCMIQVNP